MSVLRKSAHGGTEFTLWEVEGQTFGPATYWIVDHDMPLGGWGSIDVGLAAFDPSEGVGPIPLAKLRDIVGFMGAEWERGIR